MLLVAMPGAPSSFLFLVVRPGAPKGFLALFVAMPFVPSIVLAPSSKARSPSSILVSISFQPTCDGLQPNSDGSVPGSTLGAKQRSLKAADSPTLPYQKGSKSFVVSHGVFEINRFNGSLPSQVPAESKSRHGGMAEGLECCGRPSPPS